MHTDEYEISLSRELNICEKKIKQFRKVLAGMEAKYKMKTEVFAGKVAGGDITEQKDDFVAWMKEYEALKGWEVLKDQYAEMFHKMKI